MANPVQDFYKAIDAALSALREIPSTIVRDSAEENALEEARDTLTERFEGAEVLSGTRSLRWYDNGYGNLWVYSESSGPLGVVRAESWDEAFETCQDEIMNGSTWAEMIEAYGLTAEEAQAIADGEEELPEGYEFRSNGVPTDPKIHGELYCEDVNGCSLDELTPERAEVLGLIVNVRYEVK